MPREKDEGRAPALKWVDPRQLRTGEPFASLFSVDREKLARVTDNMRTRGYDEAEPIVLGVGEWAEALLVVDGHTRVQAALEAGVKLAAVVERVFADAYEAVCYAIHRSQDRHNRDDAAIMRAVEAVDRLRPRGGNRRDHTKDQGGSSATLKSHEETAKTLGVPPRKVGQARRVQKYKDLAADVKAGKMSIHAAEREAAKRDEAAKGAPPARRKPPTRDAYLVDAWEKMPADERAALVANGVTSKGAHFNAQRNEAIDWAKWSWNPVTGCLHACTYCYARDDAHRLYQQGIYPYDFAPTFYPKLLGAPANTKVPDAAKNDGTYRNVFVCSMADLFGRWVPAEWIEAVLAQVRAHPEWNFLFLTKFPKRYVEFTFPDNAWLGTTVDYQARVSSAEETFATVKAKVKWLSVEPMLEPLHFERLDLFRWLVLGGASASQATGISPATPEWRVPAEWWGPLHTEAVAKGLAVFHKSNLYERTKGTPENPQPPAVLPECFHYLKHKAAKEIAEGEAE